VGLRPVRQTTWNPNAGDFLVALRQVRRLPEKCACYPAQRLWSFPKLVQKMKHTYDLKIYNGRIKVYVDGFVMFCFNQIDFKGYYAYKDDTSLYGIDIYLVESSGGSGGSTTMEIYFKTKENWLGVLKLLDTHL
jgi:hypothetical protein